MTDFLKSSNTIKNNKISNNIKDYTWKLGKEKGEDGTFSQQSIKLIEATEEQLESFLAHCNSMLYNVVNKNKPGRCVLLEIIKDQINKCNAELFRRDIVNREVDLSYTILYRLKKLVDESNLSPSLTKLCATNLFSSESLDYTYSDLTLDYIFDALTGKLGQFDKSHLTLTFFVKQGIWFTKDEYEEMIDSELFKDLREDRIEYVREYLELPKISKIYFNPKGLSLSEMDVALSIKSKLYAQMTDDQLVMLRNRLLFDLMAEVKRHIEDWERRIEQIKAVAKHRGIKL